METFKQFDFETCGHCSGYSHICPLTNLCCFAADGRHFSNGYFAVLSENFSTI
jgi:hypothetical protein